MTHVFISYSKKHNREYARKLADKLLELGFDVWIDDLIDYGDEWWPTITRAIRDCKAFVPIMTPESDVSKWVRSEVHLADQLPRSIFPVLLAGNLVDCDFWTMFLGKQHADVRSGDLPKDDFYKRLEREVPRKATRGVEVNVPITPPPTHPRLQGEAQTLAHVGDITLIEIETDREVPYGNLAAPELDSNSEWFPVLTPRHLGWDKKPFLPQVENILPEFEWVEIPGGQEILKAGGDLSVDTIFNIRPFAMSKYPITLRQYFAFANKSGGDAAPIWWNFSADAKKYAGFRQRPNYVEDFDCPCIDVTWFDAVAFCLWLSGQTGLQIMLPSEQQWQSAATGNKGFKYPWGNGFVKEWCNTQESGIGHKTPVKQYPQGVSPDGVMDMSGNVWEWCLNNWETGDTDIRNSAKLRSVRGSAWNDNGETASTYYRGRRNPFDRLNIQGFRIVLKF